MPIEPPDLSSRVTVRDRLSGSDHVAERTGLIVVSGRAMRREWSPDSVERLRAGDPREDANGLARRRERPARAEEDS